MEDLNIKVINIAKYGFEVWCFQVKALLEGINAWSIVDGTEVRPACTNVVAQKDFDIRSGKAKRILVTSLEPSELRNILNCDTPKEIYDKLCSLYQQKDETQLQFLMQKFFRLEFSSNVKHFLADIEYLLAQIKAQGEYINDTMVINKIISSLPASYSNFSTAWESTTAAERNLNNLTSRLLKEEIKLNEKNSVSDNGAFRSSLQCYKCKGDHKIKDCPEMKKVQCFNCNKFGHLSKIIAGSGITNSMEITVAVAEVVAAAEMVVAEEMVVAVMLIVLILTLLHLIVKLQKMKVVKPRLQCQINLFWILEHQIIW
ncbi:Retrovirus-related Pol polyprotein from transposon TNT 1-94 [Lucilia cuprina]|nr:Retrovirus-related Pol polyprotein from transposon TNT 1-94 [Lucilia cuprina]